MGKQNKLLLFFILIIIAVEAILFCFFNHRNNQKFIKQVQEQEKKQQLIINKYANIPIQAKAFSVYDITENKEIYGRNQYKRFPIASVVKTLTVLVVLDNKKLDDQIEIIKEDLAKEGDNGLLLNEKWKVSDLIKFTLIQSSNDGANALARGDEKFLEKMNNKAETIGMTNFAFRNETGLDINEASSGAYASAKDINQMNAYALKNFPEIFSNTAYSELKIKSNTGVTHNVQNTNILADKIPNLLFSKTGYTKLAGGNLSIILKNKEGHEIAVTVLGSTMDGRFSDMEKLINVILS
ncbi:MAG TPA: serine hydrolase [Candidatus Paceibacterota bacterium]|nr:serine hydrolase [Candidatus Paceibacterota bacterium]